MIAKQEMNDLYYRVFGLALMLLLPVFQPAAAQPAAVQSAFGQSAAAWPVAVSMEGKPERGPAPYLQTSGT